MKRMKLAMEIFFDQETKQWGYAIPALSIVGTGCPSKEEARRLGYESIEVTLQAAPGDWPTDAEVVMFDVEVTPSAEAG